MNLSRFLLRRHFRRIGRMGGQARAAQLREPIIQRTVQMRSELGLPEDGRLG